MQIGKLVHRILSVLYALILALFIVSLSIAVPIYCRPFYYAHVEALDLPSASGYSAEQIRVAYDAVLDYLTQTGKPFSVGEMPYSADGAAHFADCKVLFRLNTVVLTVSAVGLILLWLWRKVGNRPRYRIGRYSAARCAAIAAVLVPLLVAVLATLNFEEAFEVFHALLFPGKDNWRFSPIADPIILALPVEFFMNCSLLIGGCIVMLAAVVFLTDWLLQKKSTM